MNSPNRPLVLVVDGQDASRRELCESLAASPLALTEAASAAGAAKALQKQLPVLILAELRLPDASGFGFCRGLREDPRTARLGVILVSRWASEIDRILALESGADDFLARPFSARELRSRVEAVLRRRLGATSGPAGGPPGPEEREPGSGALHGRVREVRVGGRRIDLTPRELAILSALAAAGGRVLSRRDLLGPIREDEPAPSDRCVDSHVRSLRSKLGAAAACVETVRGVGYRLAPGAGLELAG